MDKTLLFFAKILSFVLIAIGVIFIVIIWYRGDSALATESGLQDNLLTPALWISIAALFLAMFLALAFPIINMIANPKNLIRSLFILGAAAVLGIISWTLASGKIEGDTLNKFAMAGDLTEAGVRRVSAGLIITYFLFGITMLVTLYSAISGIFKR